MPSWPEKDKQYAWHPFTQHETEPAPIPVDRAQGASLFAPDGTAYLDMISSWWTCTHGHCHPAINKALADQAAQLDHVMFAGFTHPAAAELAEKLAHILPGGLNRVFYSDNGSTAVEVALKIAYQQWKNRGEEGRRLFLAFDGAYHGDTFGAMTVGQGCGFFRLYEDLFFDILTLPFPETWDGDDTIEAREAEALNALDDILVTQGDYIAGLIVEPLLQGAGGMRMCRPGFIKAVTERVQGAGIPVIFDEVATGFGRTGPMFACGEIGVVPDLICLSKGLTAGYLPMSVTVATDAIFETFKGQSFRKAFPHGHSFTANPLACAVALRSLALFEEEQTLQRVRRIEAHHRAQLGWLHDHPLADRPRVLGSILAFNLAGDEGYKSARGETLKADFLSQGLNIRPLGDAVYLLPPYCITGEQLSKAYQGLRSALDRLAAPEFRTAHAR